MVKESTAFIVGHQARLAADAQETQLFNGFQRQYEVFKDSVKEDFTDGLVVKSLPANAGDTGSIPDQGRLHVP